MPDATVLGASGFIGSRLAAELRRRGLEVFAPPRGVDLAGRRLGTVFYCIGLTGDWRSRPFETVEAHVGKLAVLLGQCEFDMLVYLSSTRLYRGADAPAEEEGVLRLNPTASDDLYNHSKALGEALALNCGRPVRVARLSNVYGPDWGGANFLAGLLRSAIRGERILLNTSFQSCKDYVSVEDVVGLLIRIGFEGRDRVYNVASGRNVAHGELLAELRRWTACRVGCAAEAPTVSFPPISVRRVHDQFAFSPRRVLDELPALVESFRWMHKEAQ